MARENDCGDRAEVSVIAARSAIAGQPPQGAAMSESPLQPPADLELTPPQPGAPGPPESASGRVKLKPEATAELDAQVRSFVDAIASLDEQDPKFKECL